MGSLKHNRHVPTLMEKESLTPLAAPNMCQNKDQNIGHIGHGQSDK